MTTTTITVRTEPPISGITVYVCTDDSNRFELLHRETGEDGSASTPVFLPSDDPALPVIVRIRHTGYLPVQLDAILSAKHGLDMTAHVVKDHIYEPEKPRKKLRATWSLDASRDLVDFHNGGANHEAFVKALTEEIDKEIIKDLKGIYTPTAVSVYANDKPIRVKVKDGEAIKNFSKPFPPNERVRY